MPPSREGTIVFPGFDGGGEWGGATYDPETGLFYVNANEMTWILRLVPVESGGARNGRTLYVQNCAACHREDLAGSPPSFPALKNLASKRAAAQVMEIMQKGSGRMPGFARLKDSALNAIDLNTGEYARKTPFGEILVLVAQGVRNTGSENYGGAIVTMDAAGNATPAMYSVNGRQFVVIGAGGGKSGTKSGGSYYAFALPE